MSARPTYERRAPVRRAAKADARALRAGGGALLAAVTALAIVQGASWLRHSDALPVRHIVVRGVDGARAEEVRAYAEVAIGDPLFAVDLAAVVGRVGRHPFVRSVSARRVMPDALELAVDPRRPAALVALPSLYLVDDEGFVMKRAEPGDGLDLPVITGLDGSALDEPLSDTSLALRRALSVLDEHARSGGPARERGIALSEIAVRPRVGLDVVFADGLRARLGNDDLRAKVVRMHDAIERLAAKAVRPTFIYLDDARRPERIAVRLRAPPEGARASGT